MQASELMNSAHIAMIRSARNSDESRGPGPWFGGSHLRCSSLMKTSAQFGEPGTRPARGVARRG